MERTVRVVDVTDEQLREHSVYWYEGDIEWVDCPDEYKDKDEWLVAMYKNFEGTVREEYMIGDAPVEYIDCDGERHYVYAFSDTANKRPETIEHARASKKSVFEFLLDCRLNGYNKIIDELADTAFRRNAISAAELKKLKNIDLDIFEGKKTIEQLEREVKNGNYKF